MDNTDLINCLSVQVTSLYFRLRQTEWMCPSLVLIQCKAEGPGSVILIIPLATIAFQGKCPTSSLATN